MTRQRVVITGLGVLSCIGSGREAFWKGILAEKTGIRRISRFDATPFRAQTAGEIQDFDPREHFDRRQARRLDLHSQMALVCARMALAEAGLKPEKNRRKSRWGAVMGTALAGLSDAEKEHEMFLKKGLRAINPLLAIQIFGGAASSNLSIEFGLAGPCSTSSNSCASGTMAVGEAFRLVRQGAADVMLAGGSEAPLAPLTFGAFDLIHTMSANADPQSACRPFDRERDGFVMAEGAGLLVLENEEHARARGARIYGEMLGYGFNSDAYHMTASLPSGECAARCMQDALEDAGLTPPQVDYINAHASSTPINDKNETTAIKLAFGEHARRIAISGTKAYYGHPLGASGAIEAVLCALALQNQILPPTLHLNHPDPNCDLDYVPLHQRPASIQVLLSNSFGFGSVNASIAMGRYSQPA